MHFTLHDDDDDDDDDNDDDDDDIYLGGGATHVGRLLLVQPYEPLAVILNPTEVLKKKMMILMTMTMIFIIESILCFYVQREFQRFWELCCIV